MLSKYYVLPYALYLTLHEFDITSENYVQMRPLIFGNIVILWRHLGRSFCDVKRRFRSEQQGV